MEKNKPDNGLANFVTSRKLLAGSCGLAGLEDLSPVASGRPVAAIFECCGSVVLA